MPYSSVAELPANVKKRPAKVQRQWMAVWNSSFNACMAKDEGGRSTCESEAFAKANGVTKGAEMADDIIQLNSFLLEKTDKKVHYREAPDKMGWACGDCRFFSYNRCSLVEGSIEPSYTCDLWTEKLPSQTAPSGMMYAEEDGFQVFVEATDALDFKDKKLPDWIPFLPKPGKFKHPVYGELEITAEQNQQMVDSVNNVVYQEHIPLDAEHETKLSGAVGWIQKMRLNDDKSADAFIEWTERGKSLVNGGGFKYVSPEWFSKWTDPATGEVHKNVVAGGAITTRPFFKDKALRALVASEAGNQVIQSDKETKVTKEEEEAARLAAEKAKGGTDDDKDKKKTYAEGSPELQAVIDAAVADAAKKAAEAKPAPEADPKESKEFTELRTELETAKTLAASEKAAREALAATITGLQNERRHERFVELVAGRGGETDGAAWPGDQAKHVEMLEKLSDQFGEADPVVTGYVENQKAIAAQMSSSLFREIGSGASGSNATDPESKIESLTQARMKEDKDLSYAKAYSEVLATPEGTRLYEESRRTELQRGR